MFYLLNERKVNSKEYNYRRDSFEDRFCDDLSEVILQYLPLKDKFRLECVSKQFQRTVFIKQYQLTTEVIKSIVNRIVGKGSEFEDIPNKSIDLKLFESLLKKCQNITLIDMKGNYDCNQSVLQMIDKYCNNLNEFSIPMSYWNEVILQLESTKLKKLEISLIKGKEDILQKVVNTFPKLHYISVLFWFINQKTIKESLKCISNLKHLKHFSFENVFSENNKLFCDSLKRMANKCQKLKSIKTTLLITSEDSNLRKLLSSFEAFPALKRLELGLIVGKEEEFEINEIFSFEAFKGLSNITHLCLEFEDEITLKETTLRDIDIFLPKLQYLEIIGPFVTTPEGVTQMADILSRLSRLETLKLSFKSGVDFKPIEEQITEKCRKIRKIGIKTFK